MQSFPNLSRKSFSSEQNRITFYVITFLLSMVCIVLFYPGIFSNDSFSQWNQAVTGHYATWHPITMSVVWSLLSNYFGVGAFFVLNQLMYWFGFAVFIDFFLSRKLRYLCIACFPPFILLSLCVWKDVAMFTALLLAVSFFGGYLKTRQKYFLILMGIFLIYSTLIRINALIIVLSLILPIGLLFFTGKQRLVKTCLLGILFIFCVSSFNWIEKKIFDPTINRPLASLLLWDISGICHFSKMQCTIPPDIPIVNNELAKNWLSYYEPTNCSICWNAGIICETPSNKADQNLILYWLKSIKEHPYAYIQHRINLAKDLFGLRTKIYFPYHNYVQNHEIGGIYEPSRLADSAFIKLDSIFKKMEKFRIFHASTWIFIEFIMLFSLIIKARAVMLDYYDRLITVLTFSGLTNALSLLFLAVAADYRYMTWTVLAGFLSLIIFLKKVKIEKNFQIPLAILKK